MAKITKELLKEMDGTLLSWTGMTVFNNGMVANIRIDRTPGRYYLTLLSPDDREIWTLCVFETQLQAELCKMKLLLINPH